LTPEEIRIGQHIAELVPDGATLQPCEKNRGGMGHDEGPGVSCGEATNMVGFTMKNGGLMVV